jgi:hypothetical protein
VEIWQKRDEWMKKQWIKGKNTEKSENYNYIGND